MSTVMSPSTRLASKALRKASDNARVDMCINLLITPSDVFPQNFESLQRLARNMPQLSVLKVCINIMPHSTSVFDAVQRQKQCMRCQMLQFVNFMRSACQSIVEISIVLVQPFSNTPAWGADLLWMLPDVFANQLLILSIQSPGLPVSPICLRNYTQLLKFDVLHKVSDIDFCLHLPVQLQHLTMSSALSPTHVHWRKMQFLESLTLHLFESESPAFLSTPPSRFQGIEQLINLNSLHICSETADSVDSISLLPTIKSLDIAFEQLQHVSPISKLSSLTHFRVWCVKVQSLDMLKCMTALKHLQIDNASGVPLNLNPKNSLELLALRNRRLSPSDLSVISALPSIRVLDLTACKGLARRSFLQLASLTSLTELQLHDTDVSPRDERTVRSALPLLGMSKPLR